MGYASTTIALFGIRLTDTEILEELNDLFMEEKSSLKFPKENEHPYRYQIQIMGEDTDSRIHLNHGYEEDAHEHVFGIFLASRGYAWSDEISDYTTNINPLVMERWKSHCVPLLNKIGIKEPKPEVHFITQVW
jgi:hypothetical protein